MKNNKKIIYLLLILSITLACGAYYYFYWDITTLVHGERSAENVVELVSIIDSDLDAGADSGVFYLYNMNEEDIKTINENICNLNGYVNQYSILQNTNNVMRVVFSYSISDNYYVYEKYKNNVEIPTDNKKATRLYEEVSRIIKNNINPEMTDYEKELALHDYIVANCQYGFVEGDEELAYEAYGALIQRHAVCNGYAEAFALLLKCVDIDNNIITGMADNQLHAWNLINLDGEWYQTDVTWDDPTPDRGNFVGHEYFNITDDIMSDTHEWQEDKFETCDSDDYNYFKKNDLICTYPQFEQKISELVKENPTANAEFILLDYDEELYDMQFITQLDGIRSIEYSIEEYGKHKVIQVYLNQKN